MKINAYLLADRSQGVIPPIPVDPVSATITAGAFYIPYHQTKYNEASTVTDKTSTYTPSKIGRTVEGVPINWSANSDFVTLRPDWSSGGVADCWIMPTKGSFTLNIGNTLSPGKYVFEVVHFVGYSADYWNGGTTKPSSRVEVNPIKTRIIKGGSYGSIEAVLNTTQQEYTDENPTPATNFSTRTIETRVRYGFTIAEGDTEKIFSWGAGTDIDLSEVWQSVHLMNLNTSGENSHSMGSWVNARLYFNVTLYTAR